jgi:hypothetical protein
MRLRADNRHEIENQRREMDHVCQLDAGRMRVQEAYLRLSCSHMQEQSWCLTKAIHAMLLEEPGENMVIIIDRNVRPGWSFTFGNYATHSASRINEGEEKQFSATSFFCFFKFAMCVSFLCCKTEEIVGVQSFVIREGPHTLKFTGMRSAEEHRRPDVACLVSASGNVECPLLAAPPPPLPHAPPVPAVPLMAINAVPQPRPAAPQQLSRQVGPHSYVTVSGGHQPGGGNNDGGKRPSTDASTPSKMARL